MFKKINGGRLFAGLIAILTSLLLWTSWKSPLAVALKNQQPFFVLMVGTDWVDHARHSDTIVLAAYHPGDRSLDLLSIPRDTKVNIPEMRVRRINEVYAYAFRTKKDHEHASRELSRAVQKILFYSDPSTAALPAPEIPYYVQIDYAAFKKVIDLLGGVPVTIDEPMHYDDNWGKLHIHFERGKTVLDGQKALEYVRFRGFSGDFGRVTRQQEFLLNVFNRFKNPVNILKLPQIVWMSTVELKTNLSWFERLLLLWEIKDLAKKDIQLVQLPGKSSKNGLWISDPEGVSATAALLVSGKKSAPEAGRLSSEDAQPLPAPPKPETPMRSKTTVEIWNASNKKGLALEVVRKLRNAGFDVVKWGNYQSRQQRTLVRDHKGDAQQARLIAEALSSSRVEVFTRVEPNPLVDVEVILGEDYETQP